MLACDFGRLAEEIASVASADVLHMDLMDGHFVPNLSFGPPIVAAAKRVSTLPLECHLMTFRPETLIEPLKDAGATRVIVHAEAAVHLDRLLGQIAEAGLEAGVALNPATPADDLHYVLDRCALVLVMTVNPGFGGQTFIPAMLEKIERVRQMGFLGRLEVDGGIDAATAELCAKAGASDFVAGTAIFKAAERAQAIAAIRAAAAPFDGGHVY